MVPSAQGLANMAWAFAMASQRDGAGGGMQHLANTAWASLARPRCLRDAALFAALARAA